MRVAVRQISAVQHVWLNRKIFMMGTLLIIALYFIAIGNAQAQAQPQNCDKTAAEAAVKKFGDASKAYADEVADCSDCYEADQAKEAMDAAQAEMETALKELEAKGCTAPDPDGDGCAVTATVAGETASFCFFNQFDDAAREQSNSWMTKIRDLGRNTFFILAAIELAWAAV